MKSKKDFKRIALVNPPVKEDQNWVREGRCQQIDIWGAPFPPFTLAMISRQLVDLGFETMIIDAGPEQKNFEQVVQDLKGFKPDGICLTVSTPTIESDLGWFLPEIKRSFPELFSVAVGVHVSTLPKETLEKYSQLELVVKGEPELAMREIFDRTKFKLQDVLGIAYRDESGIIRETASRPFIDDIDQLGIPDWEKVNLKKYIMPIKGEPFTLVHFARGCPHRCSYCTAHTFNGRKFRKRSVDSLIKELNYNLSLGVRDFLFWTELLTGDAKYLNEVIDGIKRAGLDKKIRWVCNSRVDTVSKELLVRMKEGGCWQVAFGFDFGSDRMLEQTKKGGRASVELGKKAAQMAFDAGLTVDGHFMLGYPGETEQDIQQTINMALEMPLTFSHFYSVVPYPGSELYHDWKATKNEKEIPSWDRFDQREVLVEVPGVKPERISFFKRTAYRKFYFRPSVVLRVFKIPSSISEFTNLIMASMKIAKNLVFWS